MTFSNSPSIYAEMRPYRVPVLLAVIATFLVLCTVLYAGFVAGDLKSWAIWTTPLLMVISLLSCILIMPRNFTLGFLIATLPFMITWRVGASAGSMAIMVMSTIAFIVFLLQFLDCAYTTMQRDDATWQDLAEWQWTFLRLFFGYDMVGHFTEKLFAGYDSYLHMTTVFSTKYFISLPPIFVILGGFAELAIAIGIGMGLLTRLTAVVGTLYYFVATIIGSHFLMGYTWNAGDGGWEYCVLMMVFFFSFVVAGSGKFSIDGWLLRNKLIPSSLMFLFQPKVALKH